MGSHLFREGKVLTEGDELYYKVRGTGTPLLFIAPAGGNGDGYRPMAHSLSDGYKVITYDRRATTRSTRNFPNAFDIRQQSRDALAVLKAAGESAAVVIGNSSGAVITLDLVTAFPDTVLAAIAHEPATPTVLPEAEAEKWRSFFQECYDVGKRKGASSGAMKFYFGVELPAIKLMLATLKVYKYMRQDKSELELRRIPSKEGSDVLVFNELLPVTSYRPDLDALRLSSGKLTIGCGQDALRRNTWYARAAQTLADKLSCEFVTFPGHHGAFMDQPEQWAETIREVLTKASL